MNEIGTHYTPQAWVDYTHKMISEVLGEDWKDKYTVWDSACGLANLTRGYEFKDLWLSTINQEDIEQINLNGWNPEAQKFQYDFLTDPYFDKVPKALKDSLDSGNVIFLINPPYIDQRKSGNKTLIGEIMSQHKLNRGAKQTYTQFLWKILQLKRVILVPIIPPLFLSGPSFSKYREAVIYNKARYHKGFMFPASNFEGLSNQWGVSVSIWDKGYVDVPLIKEYAFGLVDCDKKNGRIYEI